MALLHPRMVPQIVDADDVSKVELITFVNQQTRELRAALADKHNLMAMLCAIVKHPDAVQWTDDGELELDLEAIVDLKENTQLKTEVRGQKRVVHVQESTYLLHAEPVHLGTVINSLGKNNRVS